MKPQCPLGAIQSGARTRLSEPILDMKARYRKNILSVAQARLLELSKQTMNMPEQIRLVVVRYGCLLSRQECGRCH